MPPTIRRDTGRALVVRPTRPGDEGRGRIATPVSVPVQQVEEDSGEHISVQRAMTPADRKLRKAIEQMRKAGDPVVIAGFEAIAEEAREQRKAYEAEISQERETLTTTAARLAQIEQSTGRWRRPIALLKGIGFGSIVGALVICANALIAHGDSASEARKQSAMVQRHEAVLLRLAEDLARDRAQAAADHAVLSILAARLGAATP